jgi:hypothetical protein
VVATQQDADSVLLELASTIPDSYEVVYLGWNASETPTGGSPAAPVVGIHHPGVEEKRIAFEVDEIHRLLVSIGFEVNAWAIDYDNGGLEGGSSGSPLFDANHFVIGTATGVDSFVDICNQFQGYGRLEHAWDSNPAFRTALDPVGGGTTESLGHTQYFPPTPPEAFGFELVSPPDDSEASTGPALNWNGACYSEEYRVILSENSDLSNPTIDQTISAPTTLLALSAGTLDTNTTYFWTVEALNTVGTAQTETWSFTTDACPGDVDGNGATDIFDFADLADNFGAGPGATREQGDLNGDGFVDVFDFADLADDFGCGR